MKSERVEARMDKFVLVGNNLAIDFVNTEIVVDGEPADLLADIVDFAAWAASAGLVTATRANALLPVWMRRSKGLPKAVLDLRRALKAIFAALLKGDSVPAQALDSVAQAINKDSSRVELRKTAAGFEKHVIHEFDDPQQLLVPIAQAATELLCEGDLANLRKCENPQCVLLFYDITKSHRRRWCSMATCGNRAKAASFSRRQRAS